MIDLQDYPTTVQPAVDEVQVVAVTSQNGADLYRLGMHGAFTGRYM